MVVQTSGLNALIGASVQRVEDQRVLTGRGRYVDDIKLAGALSATFVRSPHAHARLGRIDATKARALPGVVAVLTGEDMQRDTNPVGLPPGPGHQTPAEYCLCTSKVRLVGDLVAMVIAENRYIAEDAAELVEVDYEPLPPVVESEQALDPSSAPLFEEIGSNLAFDYSQDHGDVDAAFAEADRVISERISSHRQANVPMETRGGIGDYNPATHQLTYHASCQSPHLTRFFLSAFLKHPVSQIRVVNSDIGGAFGLKSGVYREDVAVCAASRIVGQPVKWVEDRQEHMVASGHARDEFMDVDMAVKNDGTLLGMKVRLVMNQGAYPMVPHAPLLFTLIARVMMPGPYKFKALRFHTQIVFSNRATYTAYRGPWAVETWVRERLIDIVARRLGIDPVEIRRKNMFTQADQPTEMITGPSVYGVTSRETLDRAVELSEYQRLREEQTKARAEGRLVGIGVSTLMEFAPGPPNFWPSLGLGPQYEQAHIRIETDGTVSAITSQAPHGQGHETTLAQVVASEMGVPFGSVRVIHGDTNTTQFSFLGTGGSRAGNTMSGSATYATRKVKDKVLRIAGHLLEMSAADLEIVEGVVQGKGAPQKSMPLGQIAGVAYMAPELMPAGEELGLEAVHTYDGGKGGFSIATHLCQLEVSRETGEVTIQKYLVVEDCGRLINPGIVDGQIRGGVAQGVGAVLYEKASYGEDGQFQSATFMDYLMPTAVEIPEIQIEHLESPAIDEINFRGVGEGGMIAAPPTLVNAIEDALAPLGVTITEQHVPPYRLLELMGRVTV